MVQREVGGFPYTGYPGFLHTGYPTTGSTEIQYQGYISTTGSGIPNCCRRQDTGTWASSILDILQLGVWDYGRPQKVFLSEAVTISAMLTIVTSLLHHFILTSAQWACIDTCCS